MVVSFTTSGVAPATLDAEHLSRHFVVANGARLYLHNLILTGGFVSGGADGGSVHVSGIGSALVLLGVLLRDNMVAGEGFFDTRGGCVFAEDGSMVNATGCQFDNVTAGFGGAICVTAATFYVRGCTFARNRARRGASLAVQRESSGVRPAWGIVSDSAAYNGSATFFSGFAFNIGSYLEVNNVRIVGAYAGMGRNICCASGIIWPVSPAQCILNDVLFEDCRSGTDGAGIWTLDYAPPETAGNDMLVRLNRVTFRNCVAETDGGGAWFFYSTVELTDVIFEGCQAGYYGGGILLAGNEPGIPARLTRVNFTRCVSLNNKGGAMYMRDNAVAIYEDGYIDSCTAHEEGGAISSAIASQTLTMRHVTVYRCSATTRGGAFQFHGVADLVDTHWIECSSKHGGAFDLHAPLSLTMTGGSIVRCFSTFDQFSEASAFWSYTGSHAVFQGVEMADCHSSGGFAIRVAGTVHMNGCRLVRMGSAATSGWSGAIGAAGELVLQDTTIEGFTSASPAEAQDAATAIVAATATSTAASSANVNYAADSPASAGCLDVSGGTTSLRNVTMRHCRVNSAGSGAYLRVASSSHVVGEALQIEPDCTDSSSQPYVQRTGSPPLPLALRKLSIVTDGCIPNPSLLLASDTSIATCTELLSLSAAARCGAATICTDVPIFARGPSSLTSAWCSCTGAAFAKATSTSTAELLPYSFGCFTQRRAQSIEAVGTTTSSLVFYLTKTRMSQQTQTQMLSIDMAGSDTDMGALWQIGSTPRWLTVNPGAGSLNASETSARFLVEARTAGWPGMQGPYETVLNVSVLSGLNSVFSVPVFVFVTATTVNASWGTVDLQGYTCNRTREPTTTAIAGTQMEVAFVGCDQDGLKNFADPQSFTAFAIGSGTSVSVPIEYDAVTGDFSVIFSSHLPGRYMLTLQLAGQPVANELAVVIRCAAGQLLMDDGTCGCAAGSMPNSNAARRAFEPCISCSTVSTSSWAFPGDTTCGRCRENLFYSDATGRCEPCPLGGVCAAGSRIETIILEVGYWRLSNRTIDVRQCLFHYDQAMTPCRGGLVEEVCEGNLHGPLCDSCDRPTSTSDGSYFDSSIARCIVCPEPGARSGLISGIVLGTVAVVLVLALLTYRPPSALQGVSDRLKWISRFIAPLGLLPKAKQLVSFFQVLFSLGDVYRTSLPPEFDEYLAWIRWITFDIFDIYPPECVGSYTVRLIVTALSPLILIAVTLFVSTIGGYACRSTHKGAAVGGSIVVVIIWVLTPPVSKMILSVFDCESYRAVDAPHERRMWFMLADKSYECYESAEYNELAMLSSVFVVVWPVGMPLLLLCLLFCARRNYRAKSSLLARAIAPLASEYDAASYYWEVLEILRRLLLSAFLLAIPPDKSTMRITIALVTCFLYLCLLSTIRPFNRTDDTVVAASANLMLVFVFVIAIQVKIFDDIASKDESEAQRVLGFKSSFDASIMFIVIAFIQVAVVTAAILDKLRRSIQATRREQLALNVERVKKAINSVKLLRHPCTFITFQTLREADKFVVHEKLRDDGLLYVLDTYEMLVDFLGKEKTLFVSHQWLSFTAPDPNRVQYRALVEACDALCAQKGLAAEKLFIWLECGRT